MPIKFSCPNPACGKPLRVKDELAGRAGACPACGAPVTIPATSEPDVDLAEDRPLDRDRRPTLSELDEEPVMPARPLPRLSTLKTPEEAPAPPAAPPIVRPMLLAGVVSLALYLVSVFLPWQTVSLRGGGPLGAGSQASTSILGIHVYPGVIGLVLALASAGFLIWTWVQRRGLLVLATRIAAGSALTAFLFALVQIYRGSPSSSSGGLAGVFELAVEVRTAFGIYLAMLSSAIAGLCFGLLGTVFSAALARDIDGRATGEPGARPNRASADANRRKVPATAWIAVGTAAAVIVVGGGIAYWILSPKVSLENLPKVKSGMTLAEVEGLLGPGEVMSTTKVNGALNPFRKDGKPSESKSVRWVDKKDGMEQEVSLTFIDGKVMIGFGRAEDAAPTSLPPDVASKFEELAKGIDGAAIQKELQKMGGPTPPSKTGGTSAAAVPVRPQGPPQVPPNFGKPPAPQNITDLDGALAALKSGGFDQLRALDWLIASTPVDERREEMTGILANLADGQGALDRPKVAKALGAWAGSAQIPVLVRELDHTDQGVRQAVILALGRLKDPQAAGPLARRLTDPADRGAAARALIALGPAAAPEVQPFLQSDDRSVRKEAANILKAVGALNADATAALAMADLKDRDPGVRVHALQDLARAEPEPSDPRRAETAAVLVGLLNDPQASIRVEAARALVAWAVPDNVPVLLDALGSDSGDMRRAAIQALGRLGDKRAVQPIARRLLDGGDRSEATRALQALGPMAENETLRYLQHRDGAVRAAACRVLQMAGTRKSVQPLRFIANSDRSRDAAQAAITALDGIARRRTAK